MGSDLLYVCRHLGDDPRAIRAAILADPTALTLLVEPMDEPGFVIGYVRAPVVSIRLQFGDGRSIGAKPVDGMYLFAIPSSHLSPARQLAFVIGYDATGKRVQRQGVLFRTSE